MGPVRSQLREMTKVWGLPEAETDALVVAVDYTEEARQVLRCQQPTTDPAATGMAIVGAA